MPTDSEMTPLTRFWQAVIEFDSPTVVVVSCAHSESARALITSLPNPVYVNYGKSGSAYAITMWGVDFPLHLQNCKATEQFQDVTRTLADMPLMLVDFAGFWPNPISLLPCVMWFCPCEGLPFNIYEQSNVVRQVWSAMRN